MTARIKGKLRRGIQGATGAAGTNGPVWRGAYSGSTAYVLNDLVRDQLSTWVCIAPTTGNAPPTLPTLQNFWWSLVAQAAPGSISDGDKGDVTVSGSGTSWVIDNNVVSNGKLATMAEATFKGRAVGAGTGNPVDLTPAQALAVLGFMNVRPGPLTDNPYAGPYESWRVGIGGIGYFARNVLGNTAIRIDQGTMQVQAPFMWGDLDNATAATNSALSNRPGAILGLTAVNQAGGYNETGATAHLAQVDHVPVMHRTALGTYTSTTYTPTTPFATTATLRVEIGMYVRTDASPSHQGQITGITRNGSNEVTSITTAGFFQTGQATASAPAANTPLLWNPMDKAWGRLVTTFMSALPITMSTTSGTSIVTVSTPTLSTLLKLTSPGHRISGPGLAAGTRIIAIDAGTNIVTVWPVATSTQTNVAGIVSLGTLYGAAFGDENDVFNAGPDFNYEYIRQTVGTTSGGYTVTVPDMTPWRVGLIVSGVPSDFPFGNYVTELDFVGGRVKLKYPANATGSSAVIATNAIDEAGAGYVSASVLNRGQAAYISSGNWHNGYVANGGWGTGFLFRPGRESPRAQWGFAVDMRHNEFNTPTEGAFGIINELGTVRYRVTHDGIITATNAVNINRDAAAFNALTMTNTSGVQVILNANANIAGDLRTVTNHPLTFTTNNVERARFLAGSASFGVGTTSPTTTIHANGPIRHLTYTVAGLPAAGTVGAGTRAAVTDANATTFNAIVAGGGSNFVPVISDGTNWRIG